MTELTNSLSAGERDRIDMATSGSVGPVLSVHLINAFLLRAQTPNEDPTVPEGRVLKKVRLTQPPKQDVMTIVCVTRLHEMTRWIGSPGRVERSVGRRGHESRMFVCECVRVWSRGEFNTSLTSPQQDLHHSTAVAITSSVTPSPGRCVSITVAELHFFFNSMLLFFFLAHHFRATL